MATNTHIVNRAIAIGLAWSAAVCLAQQTGTGQISGTVVNEAGQPVELAFVSISRFPYNPKDGPASVGLTTAKDGKFSFTGLIAAKYAACVFTAPQRGFLDTCEWRQQTDLQLPAGGNVSGVTLTLQKGGQVVYEVNDPQGLKPQEGPAVQPVAHYGVVSDIGSRHFARYYFTQQGKHTYVFNVPYARKMTVRVDAVSVDVKDDAGKSFAGTGGPPANAFTLAKGDPPKKISFVISALPGK